MALHISEQAGTHLKGHFTIKGSNNRTNDSLSAVPPIVSAVSAIWSSTKSQGGSDKKGRHENFPNGWIPNDVRHRDISSMDN